MTTLVVGASGATGLRLVEQLLERGQRVRIVVRSAAKLPASVTHHEKASVIEASVLDLSDADVSRHVRGCDALASCLGHTLSFTGMFGAPRRLVTDATRRLCGAVKANAPGKPVKFVLMNTAGNSNRDLDEPISFGQQCVIWLLRLLLPPHADNENAADFLRAEIGQNDAAIEWAVVRPDGLRHDNEVTEYQVHASPTRSAIFDAGSTSRINVAHFMAELITDDHTWSRWRGQMPVIYDTKL
jgi:nucleoside-diphosphate-sugar epimerase